jgi:hypothetical protein
VALGQVAVHARGMAKEYWFHFDLYASGRWVGRSRIFRILGKESRAEACAAAEEEWLASGALAGDAYELLAETNLVPNMYTLRDNEDSPTKE